jgi:hypothetical protein
VKTQKYSTQDGSEGSYTTQDWYDATSEYPVYSTESGTRNGVEAFIVHTYDKNGNIAQMNDTLFNGVDKNDPRYQ